MFNYIKKHRICLSMFTLLLIGISIGFYYFLRDQNDRKDARLFSIPMLSEPSKTVIEYKTNSHTKYYRCFRLVFKSNDIRRKFKNDNFSLNNRRHNHYMVSDKEFYSEIKGKPYFKIKIIHKGAVEGKELYIMRENGRFFKVIDEKKTELSEFEGFWAPRTSACYYFEPNSTYQIDVENNTPLDEFKELEAFLLIRPDRLPKVAWENIN